MRVSLHVLRFRLVSVPALQPRGTLYRAWSVNSCIIDERNHRRCFCTSGSDQSDDGNKEGSDSESKEEKDSSVEESSEDSFPDHETEDERRERIAKIKEVGGPEGPEPTRFGDWGYKGRCTDF